MKVLVIFSSCGIGGAEKSISRALIQNKDGNIKYFFATLGGEGELSSWFKSKEGEIILFDNKLIALVKFIIDSDFEVIYTIGFKISVFIRLIKLFKPSLKVVQGVRWNPVSNSKLDIVFRLFERLFSRLIDLYIVNSKAAYTTLISLGLKKVSLIYNGIYHDFNSGKIYEKKNQIITVANLSERKGFENYLNSIEKILKIKPDTKFIFLGHDYLKGKIQRMILERSLENVQYLGFKNDISPYLGQSDIFVLPSIYGEGCPTSILEAFSMALPVVAFDIDGIPEIVDNNIDGFLIPSGRYDLLEEKIINLLSDSDNRKSMGSKGKDKVSRFFSIEKNLSLHNKSFLEIK